MQLKLRSTNTLSLQPQMQWLWYSNTLSCFITGDDRQAFSLATTGPAAPVQLASARAYDDRIPPRHPCNLPIPASQYEELTTISWHGFRFLEPAAYEKSLDGGPPAEGDLLRTLVFGPDYMQSTSTIKMASQRSPA